MLLMMLHHRSNAVNSFMRVHRSKLYVVYSLVICSCVVFYLYNVLSMSSIPSNIHQQHTLRTSQSDITPLKLLSDFMPKNGDHYRVLTFASVMKTAPPPNDITLVTHGSIKKWNRILEQSETWGGPVSLALWLCGERELAFFRDFLQSSDSRALIRMDIHLMAESCEDETAYPMNLLRNIALENARTEFVLSLDADFIPNSACYEQLRSYIQSESDQKLLRKKSAFVVPAFELFMVNNKTELDDLPAEKSELLRGIAQKKLAPFHEYFKAGHGPTDYSQWYKTDKVYQIEYAARFEPYVVVHKAGLPRLWEGFRGFGFNKASWLLELHFLQYKFYVLPNVFVVHMNHVDGGEGRWPKNKVIQEWFKFKYYLHLKYGATKSVMDDYFGFGDYDYQ